MRHNESRVVATPVSLGALRVRVGAALAVAAALLLAPSLLAPPETRQDDWLTQVQRQLESREYHASLNGVGLQAPNRAQNLRTYFEATGIRVHDRTAPGSPELLSLSLAGIGRSEQLAPLAAGVVAADGPRVEIRRQGIVEWYVNTGAGLEQGFTLDQRPSGRGPLLVDLTLDGASASLQDDAVIFSATSGRSLRYDHLAVADASGRSLSASLSVPSADRVRIIVEDAGAAYPIVIDPILTETPDTVLSSNSSAYFGKSVAGAGDVNNDGFDDVIVGAPGYDAGETDEGAAFVFLGSASGIPNGEPGDADAQLESDQVDALLGSSVASAGDVNNDGYDDVIVGAPYYTAGETAEGAAFVFLGSASGIADGDAGSAAAQLEADQANAHLGSVASAGDVNDDGYDDVIVGAPGFDAGETDEGAAFIFLGGNSGIADGDPGSASAQLESDQAGAILGSVASAGDVNGDGYDDVIVGAPGYDAGETDEGAAFIFLGSGSGIADGDSGSAATQLESDQANATFGGSVASAGDVNYDGRDDVIVGAELYDAGEALEGAAFVFMGSASGIPDGDASSAAAQLESNEYLVQFGGSVAGAGDANGDGYDDVIVGALSGIGYVFLGSSAGISDGNSSTAYAELGSGLSSASVAGAGDIDGDGAGDAIVGGIQTTIGAAAIFLGEPDHDGDGVLASTDNCLSKANSNQVDTDHDGYGQFCDFDWNNNGIVSLGEISLAASQFGNPACGAGSGPPFNNCVCDFNQNGVCSLGEVTTISSQFGLAPGPSGLTCAGTIPCP